MIKSKIKKSIILKKKKNRIKIALYNHIITQKYIDLIIQSYSDGVSDYYRIIKQIGNISTWYYSNMI